MFKTHIYFNPATFLLYKMGLKEGCEISSTGALMAKSGEKTGRSPKDKRIVYDEKTENIWWGDVNIKLSNQLFNYYRDCGLTYLDKNRYIYQIDAYAGWDGKNSVKVRVYCTTAYHALFMKNILIPVSKPFDKPDFTIYNCGCEGLRKYTEVLQLTNLGMVDKTLNNTLVALNFTSMEMIIFGTNYAGEMKKGILTLMMYLMPIKNYLPLHSSANLDNKNRTDLALFFGLSGTGKCLGRDTPILMFNGDIKLVQNIRVGDRIMGDDSKPRRILSICSGKEMLYRVTSLDNSVKYIVNESHILSLKSEGNIVDIPIKEYFSKKDNVSFKGYRVSITFPHRDVDVNPYIVGFYLINSDGKLLKANSRIIEYVKQDVNRLDIEMVKKNGDIFIKFKDRIFLDLSNNRHIPYIYKCNSRENQKLFLEGILDATNNNNLKVRSKKLADDIIYLCHSLGYGITCHYTGIHYKLSIKNSLVGSTIYDIRVDKLEVGDYYGFEIDGNGRFLLGDFTVTHNTTLSTDPNRILIGDDEHVWTDINLFNIEGGCYAKCINLDKKKEPDIYNAIKYGAILENVVYDKDTFEVNYNDTSITENTRCAFPLKHIEIVQIPASVNLHPRNIIFLTCDAYGVFPPVSKLTLEQAVYFFINGYTSKIPGTEVGVVEPEPTFSSCFGEPFLVWNPLKYGELLKEKVKKHNVDIWMMNTGWIEGPYGVGKRIPLEYSRKIVDNIHNGVLKSSQFEKIDILDLNIPKTCPGVDTKILNPLNVWIDKDKYYGTVKKLLKSFEDNYIKKSFI